MEERVAKGEPAEEETFNDASGWRNVGMKKATTEPPAAQGTDWKKPSFTNSGKGKPKEDNSGFSRNMFGKQGPEDAKTDKPKDEEKKPPVFFKGGKK